MNIIMNRIVVTAAALALLAPAATAVRADDTSNAAYAAFGVSGAECSGMTASNTGDPAEITEEHEGKTGWRIGTSGAQANIRCKIDDGFMYGLDGTCSAVVEVEYFDDSYGGFCVYYDSRSGRRGEPVQLEDSGTWKTKEFRLYDAYFGNGLYTDDLWITTNRPDVMGVSSDPVLIGSVTVRKNEKAAPFEISVETGRTGNIFFEGDEIAFDISYENTGSKEYELCPEYVIRSYDGKEIKTYTSRVSAAPSASDRLTVSGLPYGVYTLEIRLEGADIEQTYTADFSYARKADSTNFHFGINIHYDDENYTEEDVRALTDLIKNSGFGFVRSSLRWEQIETARGVYSIPPVIAEAVRYADETGLETLGILYPENDLYGSYPYYEMDSAQLAAFEAYCRFVAEELKEHTHYYCMLNEINHDASGYLDNEEDYVRIAEAGYRGLKAGDPEAFINGGSLAGWSRDYANKTYELGILDYCDSYSMQIYNHSDGPETDWMFRSVTDHKYWLEQYDTTGTKESWITESGWPTRAADDTADETASRAVANAHDSASETEQAQWYARSMAINGDRERVDKYIYYAMCDNDIDRFDIQSNFGILRAKNYKTPFAAKPAFITACAYNDLIGDAEFIGDDITDDSGWAYRYKKPDGSVVTCVWGAEYYGQAGVGSVYTYNSSAPYIVLYDMYGNARYIENDTGSYAVPIEEQPVYVTDAQSVPEDTDAIAVKQNGETLSCLEQLDSSVPLEAGFAADLPEGGSVTVVCAAYIDGRLENTELREAVCENGAVSASFDSSELAGADEIKVMAFDSMERLIPLKRAAVIGRSAGD